MAAGYAQSIQIDAVLDVPVSDREQEGVHEPCPVAQTKTRRQWPSPLLESTRPRQNRCGVPQAPCRRGARLRAVILADYPAHMPEFEIALHTGMRPSEQYGLIWSRVDLVRKLITIPKSKNGNTRHIPLNSVAQAAFEDLFARSSGQGRVFVNMQGGPLKGLQTLVRPCSSRGRHQLLHLVLLAAHICKPLGDGRRRPSHSG